jgi:hypothetical protein
MDNQDWYKKWSYEIPAFIKTVYDLLIQKSALSNQLNDLNTRLYGGVNYFENNQKDPEKLIKGAMFYAELLKQARAVNEQITSIDTQINGILEAKLANIGFVINTSPGENEYGVSVDKTKIYCLPWKVLADEDTVVVSPEDVFFFRAVKKVFDFNPSNLEFIPQEKLQQLLEGGTK